MVEAGGAGNDSDSSYRLKNQNCAVSVQRNESFPFGFRVLPCGGILYSSLGFGEDSPNLKIRQKNVKTEVFTFSSLVKAAVVRGPRKFDGGNSDTCFSLQQLIFCCGQTNCVVHWQLCLQFSPFSSWGSKGFSTVSFTRAKLGLVCIRERNIKRWKTYILYFLHDP